MTKENKKSPAKLNQVELLPNLPNVSKEPRFRARVIANNKINEDTISIHIEKPDNFTFTPGQYIWLVLPELSKHKGTIDRKAYSIVSSIDSDTLDLLVHITNSEYLSKVKALKENDEVNIIGPMGSAFLMPKNGAIVIANGIGIAQFLSILQSQKTKKNISIIICNYKNPSPYSKELFYELSKKYGYQIFYHRSKLNPCDFQKIIDKEDKRQIFISGSQDFVNSVTEILLECDVSLERMHYEENYLQTEMDRRIKYALNKLVDADHHNDLQVSSKLNDLFLRAIKQTISHVIITDRNGRVIFANQAASNMTGYTYTEMRGQTARLWGGLMPDSSYKKLWSLLNKGVAVKGNIVNRHRNGNLYTVVFTIVPIIYNDSIVAFMGTEEDITTLQELDSAKSELMPIISHQLRTLLSVISWYTEMLIDGDAGKLSNKQTKYLKAIYSGNQHMTELLNSLLSISRIELGALTIEPVATNVIELAQNVVNEQKIEINEKKIKFSYLFDDDMPVIYTDPKLLRMVIQNLLSNAVNYTPENGVIDLNISIHDKDNIILKITDTGCGIPKDQQSRIFNKLFRADNAKLKSAEGTGLGLYIVKSITDRTGGKVWFKSKENKGTTFYVLIPVKSKIKK